jgi:hypothetical protein
MFCALRAGALPPVRQSIWLLARSLFLNSSSRFLQSQAISGAEDSADASIEDVGVDHRSANIPMPKQFLNRSDIVAIFQQVSSKRMA